ncbi:hypothetical protein B0H17DRAFT_1140094 [Mycena rosella]|uniref:Uncharacterized protein n=1 Tax=Mycena rosella TaxID=1033263 RepID=A0AAD7D387_MYCRO|nr:hypothetical protein B0H17DRAFT_1140094 [Mycena rosella]
MPRNVKRRRWNFQERNARPALRRQGKWRIDGRRARVACVRTSKAGPMSHAHTQRDGYYTLVGGTKKSGLRATAHHSASHLTCSGGVGARVAGGMNSRNLLARSDRPTGVSRKDGDMSGGLEMWKQYRKAVGGGCGDMAWWWEERKVHYLARTSENERGREAAETHVAAPSK